MNLSKSALLTASLATACAVFAEPGELISLADGIMPLATRFNNQQDRAQVVAILSPT